MTHSPPAPPERLGRYAILARIARGGMGTVWAARVNGALGFEKLVAIKTIRSDFAQEEPFRTMFLDEVRLLSRIEHPHVARVLDVGDHEGRPYIVLEWVEGASVAALSREVLGKNETVPIPVVLRIVSDAALGLHAVHELCDEAGGPLHVVHRDVSPQNVLVDENGVVKLIDFGIAKARDRLTAETSASALKGKISYMAPEQARGSPVDCRADVFALGAVAYELLSGRSPYAASNETATLHRLITGDPPPLPLPAHVPPAVGAIVLHALEREADRRFSSAAEMRTAIESVGGSDAAFAPCSQGALGQYVKLHLEATLAARRELVRNARDRTAEAETLVDREPPVRTTAVPGRRRSSRNWALLIAGAAAGALVASVLAWRVNARAAGQVQPAPLAASIAEASASQPSEPSLAVPGPSMVDEVPPARPTGARFSKPTRPVLVRPKASASPAPAYQAHHPDYGGF